MPMALRVPLPVTEGSWIDLRRLGPRLSVSRSDRSLILMLIIRRREVARKRSAGGVAGGVGRASAKELQLKLSLNGRVKSSSLMTMRSQMVLIGLEMVRKKSRPPTSPTSTRCGGRRSPEPPPPSWPRCRSKSRRALGRAGA